MKTVWKSFLRDPCRSRELTEEEQVTLSHYDHVQRYFPALDAFRYPDSFSSQASLELPSLYTVECLSTESPCSSTTRIWNAQRIHSETKASEPCSVFMKVVHLIHPMDRIREKYTAPSHPLLPSSSAWTRTVSKIHHRNNQAYVDTVANFVLSRFRERNLLPHLVLYYGAYTAISKSYRYQLTGEYDSYRQYRWFWEGLKKHKSRLTLSYHDSEQKDQTFYQRLYEDITRCPVEDELLSLSSSSSTSSFTSNMTASSTESRKSSSSITLDDIDGLMDIQDEKSVLPESTLQPLIEEINTLDGVEECVTFQQESESEESDGSSESESDSDSWMDDVDICAEVPNLPVMMILQEAQQGSMDELLDLDVLDGNKQGSAEWEKRWIAWLFQVVATLAFLQNAVSFTHNDLHTNNILWRTTDKPYLYYRLKDKTIWRVPTYGKIFCLIDFGRSIFRIGKHQWISDDHYPNEDAAGQYNYGPFYDKKQPKVEPNPAFDLCRLSVSLLSGLYDEPPPKKKGKKVRIMSEEGSWRVYETQSTLYNLLWAWTLDNAGRTVYENRHGEERFEGFDLYIHIAHHVHGAVPSEQLHRPLFQGFVWKQPVPVEETVYGLDA